MKHSRIVFVVSDEIATRESIRQILREKALVLETDSFVSAQEQMIAHRPDLLILDAPILKGRLELGLHQVRRLVGETAILLLTLMDDPQLRQLAKSLNVELLQKPFDSGVFRDLCDRILERIQLQQENRKLKSAFPQIREDLSSGRVTLTQMRLQGKSYEMERPGTLFPQPLTPFSAAQGLYLILPRLNIFLKALVNFQNVKKLAERTVEGVTELLGLSFCFMMVIDEVELDYYVAASHGLDEILLRDLRPGMDSPLIQYLIQNNQCLSQEECRRTLTGEAGYAILRQMEILRAEWIFPFWNKGRLLGILGVSRKISGRTFLEEELDLLIMLGSYVGVALENALFYQNLRHQKAFNENILHHLGSGVLAIDTQGHILSINQNGLKILGLPSEQLIGQKIESAGSVVADILLRTVEENRSFSRHEFYYPYGQKLIGAGTTVMKDSDGRRVGAVMVFADLSEIKPIEGAPNEDRAIEELVNLTAWLAHEIKNPLVAIKTFTQLLPDHFQDPEFRGKFSEVVQEEVNRLDSVVDSVVEFGRREAIQRQPVDIHPVLDSVLEDIQSQLKSKQIHIEKQYEVHGRMVAIDQDQMKVALRHLFLGAIGASEDRQFWLRTAIRTIDNSNGVSFESGDYLGIYLYANPGCVPKKELRQIFLPYQGSEITGSRLALGIAQKIIRQHQGWVEVADDADPTVDFVVLLPMIHN